MVQVQLQYFDLKTFNICYSVCELDPLPTSQIKDNIDVLAPHITNIVNKSFVSGIFQNKLHYVRPLIKKTTLDKGVFNGWQLAKMKKSIPDMSLP